MEIIRISTFIMKQKNASIFLEYHLTLNQFICYLMSWSDVFWMKIAWKHISIMIEKVFEAEKWLNKIQQQQKWYDEL